MKIAIACGCGARIEAEWDSSGYRREITPVEILRFERAHKACTRAFQEGKTRPNASPPTP